MASAIDADFARIQFTPDLLPADLIGTLIYSQKKEEFVVRRGPIFANFVLADEINRSPAKVQSALLEAMQEHQVTIGDEIFNLRYFDEMKYAEMSKLLDTSEGALKASYHLAVKKITEYVRQRQA